MRNRVQVAGAVVLVLALCARPALAQGCCDSFWSCAATVATDGLACKAKQILEAIDSAKHLLGLVTTAKSGLHIEVESAISTDHDAVAAAHDELAVSVTQSSADVAKAVAATQLYATPPSRTLARAVPGAISAVDTASTSATIVHSNAGNTTSSSARINSAPARSTSGSPTSIGLRFLPAEAGRIVDDLKRAAAQVDVSSHQVANLGLQANASASNAMVMVAARIPVGRKVADDELFSPMDVIVAALTKMIGTSISAAVLDPLGILGTRNAVDKEFAALTGRVPATFERVNVRITTDPNAEIEKGKEPANKARDIANESNQIAEAAGQLSKTGSELAANALEKLIGTPVAPPRNVALVTGGGHVSAVPLLARATAETKQATMKSVVLTATLTGEWEATKALLAPPAPGVAAEAGLRVHRELDAMFSGKSKPQVQKLRMQLLEQARTLFASDPKTLDAVQRYLNEQSAERVSARDGLHEPT